MASLFHPLKYSQCAADCLIAVLTQVLVVATAPWPTHAMERTCVATEAAIATYDLI
jgi:hypothetical protein